MFEVGHKIGNYEIVSPLRAGGMGSLFLGRRIGAAGFTQTVAIKIIHPHLSTVDSFARAFVREAHLSARISHPNVVHVEELGEAHGSYYLVMEYVDGCSLAQFQQSTMRMRRAILPATAVAIAIQVADGLHAAHETRGEDGNLLEIIHRDVSPQNVLLSYDGHVKLIDFGIAKALQEDEHSETGSFKGKLRYMSPEQAWGRSLDRRSDIYALGIVLWELVTCRRYFEKGRDLAILDRVRNPGFVVPSFFQEGIDQRLDQALQYALSPNPDDRPETARAFKEMLIDAEPNSLRIDSTQLSDLIGVIMADHIEQQTTPALQHTRTEPPPQRDDEAMFTLTVPMRPVEEPEEIGTKQERHSNRARPLFAVLALIVALVSAGIWLWPPEDPANNERVELDKVEKDLGPRIDLRAAVPMATAPTTSSTKSKAVRSPKVRERPTSRKTKKRSREKPLEEPLKKKPDGGDKILDGVPLETEPDF